MVLEKRRISSDQSNKHWFSLLGYRPAGLKEQCGHLSSYRQGTYLIVNIGKFAALMLLLSSAPSLTQRQANRGFFKFTIPEGTKVFSNRKQLENNTRWYPAMSWMKHKYCSRSERGKTLHKARPGAESWKVLWGLADVSDWPRYLFRFFHKMLQKTQMNFLANPMTVLNWWSVSFWAMMSLLFGWT